MSLIALLSGCAINNIQTNARIDPREKTISVPAGSFGFAGDLKRALKSDDWQLSVANTGPEVTEGKLGVNTKIQTYNTYINRYRLFYKWRQIDVCFFPPSAWMNYEISIIDNKTHTEVLALDGRDCGSNVVKTFYNALKTVE